MSNNGFWPQVVFAVLVSVIAFVVCPIVHVLTARIEDARRESCSYRCLHDTGRWPARVEWRGRDEQGRIKCECLNLEKTR